MSEPSTNANGNGHGPANGTASGNGHALKTNGRVRRASDHESDLRNTTALIEHAQKLRAALHSLLHEASELVKSLKQHRRQSRAVQQTIAQLRTLKTLV
mgnify:CR=1 FL=1